MANEWSHIHHAVRRCNQGVATEITYGSDVKRRYVYGSKPDQYVEYYIYQNSKYVQTIYHARRRIKELLKLGNKPKYYSNFVMLADESFNGITPAIVDELKHEVYDEIRRDKLRELKLKLNEGDD